MPLNGGLCRQSDGVYETEARLVGQLGAADAESLIEKRARQIPMKQAGTGWDVAHAILYLVSKGDPGPVAHPIGRSRALSASSARRTPKA